MIAPGIFDDPAGSFGFGRIKGPLGARPAKPGPIAGRGLFALPAGLCLASHPEVDDLGHG